MDDLIQKYLDGGLSDEEASALAEALVNDPELDAELHAFEKMLAVAARHVERDPPEGFTGDVMERIGAAAARVPAPRERPAFIRGLLGGSRAWGLRLAWTAGFALVFALGFMTARRAGLSPGTTGPQETAGVAAEGDLTSAASLRMVRLVYVPRDPNVDEVAVAGTFNGWDPKTTTMRREDGVWVVQLVLPRDSYEYMFIENGERWVTDPLALQTRDDGFGRKNAVLDLTM